MPELFHFQEPAWLLAMFPLLVVLWLMRKPAEQENAWRRVCDARLLPYLLTSPDSRASRLPLWLLGAGWLLIVLALADPVWEQQAQPVYRNEAARVVVLDLSNSMFSPDLKPSRLVRARYKVADILDQELDGQTALVVFSGDAFAVTPLTSDSETVRALLSPLEPGLMPSQGSRVDLGLQKAGQLLRQAGALQGDILVITDGYEDERTLDVAAELEKSGYRISVLGVGTEEGAPIPVVGGGFLRDNSDNIVIPALDRQALQALAKAGGGRYATISSSAADIKRLLQLSTPMNAKTARTDHTTDSWRSQGALIILLILPLAALAFRRGWLMMLLVSFSVGLSTPQPVMAAGWDDLWLRSDQQAARALQAGDAAAAARLATDPALRGTAAYQAGDYEQALDAFSASASQHADYNQGNALAQLGRYEEAIAAYDRALEEQPGMPDAEHNRAEVEKLLQQQQQQQQQQQEQSQQGEQQDQQNQQGQQDQSGEQGDQQQAQDGSQGEPGDQQQNAATDPANQQQQDQGQRQSAEAENANEADGELAPLPQQSEGEATDSEQQGEMAEANPLDSEEQLAAEQWLRRIPDDPGGLLRRKFLYQYRQQSEAAARADQQAW